VASRLANLANVFDLTKNFSTAIKLREQAIQISENHYGLYHYENAVLYLNLAISFCNFDDFSTATQLFEKAILIMQKCRLFDHPLLADIHYNFGNYAHPQKLYLLSKTEFEKSLEIYNKNFAPDHRYVVQAQSQLAKLLELLESQDRKVSESEVIALLKAHPEGVTPDIIQTHFAFEMVEGKFDLLNHIIQKLCVWDDQEIFTLKKEYA